MEASTEWIRDRSRVGLEQHALADPAAANVERRAERLRGCLENDQPGGQEPYPLEVEGEATRDISCAVGRQDCKRPREAVGVEQRADQTAQRGGAAADSDALVRTGYLDSLKRPRH